MPSGAERGAAMKSGSAHNAVSGKEARPKNKRFIVAGIIAVLLLVGAFFADDAVRHIVKAPVYAVNTQAAYTARTLKEGDYVLLGTYGEEPLLWRVIAINNKKATLFSEHVICFKAFSAAQGAYRFGINDFEHSTLRRWLNATEVPVWGQAVPSAQNVFGGYNAYDTQAGFLNPKNFSVYERSLLTPRGVFLLSQEQLQMYLTEQQRAKTPTAAAIRQDASGYVHLPQTAVWYFTASQNDTSSMSVVTVTKTGAFYKTLAYDSSCGVAPAMEINASVLVNTQTKGTKESPYYVQHH